MYDALVLSGDLFLHFLMIFEWPFLSLYIFNVFDFWHYFMVERFNLTFPCSIAIASGEAKMMMMKVIACVRCMHMCMQNPVQATITAMLLYMYYV